jgi:hypothetical protein
MANAWTYRPLGSIESVQPRTGRVGTIVTIFGFSLCGGGTSVAEVLLAGFAATIRGGDCGQVLVEAQDFGANVQGAVTVTSNTGADADTG